MLPQGGLLNQSASSLIAAARLMAESRYLKAARRAL